MKTPGKKPHWQGRRRHVSNGRMAWYGAASDERYWFEYWKARLTPDYYNTAENAALMQEDLGQILLKYLQPAGLHLDAGCGAGYWVAALRHQGFMIEGIEYAPALVEMAQAAYPQLPVRQGNALQRRSVRLGRRASGLFEILAGLQPGDDVLISQPPADSERLALP